MAAYFGASARPFHDWVQMTYPKINPVMLLSPVEDGYVAYDPVLDRLHHLNPVAALVAELSDGSRSTESICELVCPLLPGRSADVIIRWIQEGMNAGLLVTADSSQASASELGAAELAKLTKRLREAGKVQTAYLCGRRTVELNPTNWDAWYDLGEIAQCVGRREEARLAYQKYFDANPYDGEIEHLLIALRDESPPERASNRAIQHIYKNFAPSYDHRMLDELKYSAPQRMREAVKASTRHNGKLTILDLGCGSGLTGAAFKEFASNLIGVDLSAEMIELARARNVYDRLELGEINEWLAQGDELFDVIVTCDCLIYFGDLTNIVNAARRRLKPGGIFGFSLELGMREPFHLTDTGRYNHHPSHVRSVAANSNMNVEQLNEAFLRMEYGEEVKGLFAVLRHPVQ
jgi:predicted TPR repeat methyltransferase